MFGESTECKPCHERFVKPRKLQVAHPIVAGTIHSTGTEASTQSAILLKQVTSDMAIHNHSNNHSNRFSKVVLSGAIALGGLASIAADAQAFSLTPPSSTEIGKYLLVGTKKSANGDAVNVQNTELGADRQLLSDGGSVLNSQGHGGPNTRDVFQERWEASGGSATMVPTGAANIFEGIDWSGNIAVTSNRGKFSLSDVDLFADIGVQCARSQASRCKQSVSNSNYFADQQTNSSGRVDNNIGISSFDSSALLGELTDWKSFINNLSAEHTITDNIEQQNGKDGNGPLITDLDLLDVDNDGLVVIDINIDNGNSDFELNNSDWILQGSKNKQAIFRIQGESNFNLSNSSILLGDRGIGTQREGGFGGMGAIFVKSDTHAEGADSGDAVFNFNNVVLNGIGVWDLVTVSDQGKTEINVNNGQGCAQFISSTIDFNDVRWNKCSEFFATPVAPPDPEPEKIPEPTSVVGIAIAAAIGHVGTKRRRHEKSR